MGAIRTVLITFFLFIFSTVRAFDSCVHVDLKRAETLPGWQALQQLFYPDLALNAEEKLKQQGIAVSLTGFALLSEGEVFDLYLDGVTENQLDYLLKHKMLHPSWTCTKENGIYHISGENGEKLMIRSAGTGMRFTNGAIRKKVLLNFKKQKGMIIQGVILCTEKKDQHPALNDVSLIYFYLCREKEKFIIDLFIRGEDRAANDRIMRDLNIYFSKLYASAAQEMVIDANFFNIYKLSRDNVWVKLRITLTPEQAKEFFEQFGTAMKDMLR